VAIAVDAVGFSDAPGKGWTWRLEQPRKDLD